VKSASDALAAHDAETHTLLKQYRRGTGLAFVTFGSPAEADAARVALNAPGYPHRFHGRRLAAQRAPEPSDVKWENLEVPNRERR
jgi:RNA recognition motif-containing protein